MKNEIDEFCSLVKAAKAQSPQLRICQIIENACAPQADIGVVGGCVYYVEDDEAIVALKSFIKNRKQS